MSGSGEYENDGPQTGGCPTCGASPDRIVEKPQFAKPMFRSYYCGACGCRLGGEKA